MPLTGDTVTVRDLVTSEPLTFKLGGVVGVGAFRRVFDCGDGLVAKIKARKGDEFGGYNSNQRELECWFSAMGTDAAQYLCPIIAASDDDLVLIQVKCSETYEDRIAQMDRQYSRRIKAALTPAKLRQLSSQFQEEYTNNSTLKDDFTDACGRAFEKLGFDAYDMHGGNIGIMRDGTYSVIDYGNFVLHGTY